MLVEHVLGSNPVAVEGAAYEGNWCRTFYLILENVQIPLIPHVQAKFATGFDDSINYKGASNSLKSKIFCSLVLIEG